MNTQRAAASKLRFGLRNTEMAGRAGAALGEGLKAMADRQGNKRLQRRTAPAPRKTPPEVKTPSGLR